MVRSVPVAWPIKEQGLIRFKDSNTALERLEISFAFDIEVAREVIERTGISLPVCPLRPRQFFLRQVFQVHGRKNALHCDRRHHTSAGPVIEWSDIARTRDDDQLYAATS